MVPGGRGPAAVNMRFVLNAQQGLACFDYSLEFQRKAFTAPTRLSEVRLGHKSQGLSARHQLERRTNVVCQAIAFSL